jgi:hypothetical protein
MFNEANQQSMASMQMLDWMLVTGTANLTCIPIQMYHGVSCSIDVKRGHHRPWVSWDLSVEWTLPFLSALAQGAEFQL